MPMTFNSDTAFKLAPYVEVYHQMIASKLHDVLVLFC